MRVVVVRSAHEVIKFDVSMNEATYFVQILYPVEHLEPHSNGGLPLELAILAPTEEFQEIGPEKLSYYIVAIAWLIESTVEQTCQSD